MPTTYETQPETLTIPRLVTRGRIECRSAVALDAGYEACSGVARWERQYWWPERVWRWVKTTRLEWGRCVGGADPDAAMQPDDTLFPSAEAVNQRGGEVKLTPITQNKPKSCVELDAERAAQRIAGGEMVQVDARAGNVTRVTRRVLELTNPCRQEAQP